MKLSGEKLRIFIQTVWTVISNGFLVGFVSGRIYQGNLKNICLPGMNCYSCPGALGSCPIGALQASFGGRGVNIPFYVIGFLVMVGAFSGRIICGFLCPFGLIQDLLFKIPFVKKIHTFKGDKLLRKVKYIMLAVFVMLLPMFAVDFTGLGQPYFCKYVCPVGSFEGGIPLVLLNEGLRASIGFLYFYKMTILVVILILSILIYRPFCKYICPLGAIYSFFNKVSLLKLKVDEKKCISCKKCSKTCGMNVDPTKDSNHSECIRCMKCKNVCPTKAIAFGTEKYKEFSKNSDYEKKN